jgi:hypothetical protein
LSDKVYTLAVRMNSTANSQQPTANSQQPTANSQQPTANPPQADQQPNSGVCLQSCQLLFSFLNTTFQTCQATPLFYGYYLPDLSASLCISGDYCFQTCQHLLLNYGNYLPDLWASLLLSQRLPSRPVGTSFLCRRLPLQTCGPLPSAFKRPPSSYTINHLQKPTLNPITNY